MAAVLYWLLVAVFHFYYTGLAGPERYLIYFFIMVMAPLHGGALPLQD
jgi:hypothetical protein